MTWTQVGGAAAGGAGSFSASSPSTVAPTFPAGTVVAGDLLIVAIAYEGGSSTTVTPPAGWTAAKAKADATTNCGTVMYWKTAVGGEGGGSAGTWTLTNGVHGTIHTSVWHNDAGTIPSVNATGTDVTNVSGATSVNTPAVTTTGADCLILRTAVAARTTSFTWTIVTAQELSDSYAANVVGMETSFETSGAATTGARLATHSGTNSTAQAAQTIAFVSAAAPVVSAERPQPRGVDRGVTRGVT